MRLLFCCSFLFVKRGVDRVKVLAIKLFLSDSQGIANTVNIEVLDNFSQSVVFFRFLKKLIKFFIKYRNITC